jgi:hypothetical protein
MKTKDITLSASLLAIYIAINALGNAAPIRITSMMQSALFGIFWGFFPLKLNLTFQGFRIGWNLIGFVRSAPKIVNYMKLQSIAGMGLLDQAIVRWGGTIDTDAYAMLETLGTASLGLNFWIFCLGYLTCYTLIFSYGFYRWFRFTGLFKRLPSF